MNLSRYEFKSGEKFLTYQFLSEGEKGKITKVVQFTSVNQSNLYNLGFAIEISKPVKLTIWLLLTMAILKKFLQQL